MYRGNQITKPVNNGIWYESEDLASAAYSLNVSVFNPWSNRRNSTMQVASGEIVSLIVHAYDQFRNKRPAMWTAKLPDNTEVCSVCGVCIGHCTMISVIN